MKMKNKLIGLSLNTGILVSVVLLGTTQVNAAEVSKGSSTANFELQAGDSTTVPEIIDPGIEPGLDNK